MPKSPDVAVVGLGVMGAAVTCELARRGVRVLGIDAAAPPHELGSSHGRTRIIREAYYEHPLYVPLVQRAFDLWLELEELTGTVLYRQSGGIVVGRADAALVQGALASVRTHGIEHEVLDATAMRTRFPALSPRDDHVGVYEARAGLLLSDACQRTLLNIAQGYGATLQPDTRLISWSADADRVRMSTAAGEIEAAHVVFAAGAWLNDVLASERGDHAPLRLPLSVERQTPHWIAAPERVYTFRAEHCPVTLLEADDGRILYTLPDIGHGVKAGIHHRGDIGHPDAIDRAVHPEDERALRSLLDDWMPALPATASYASVCLYTNTPDHRFVLDRHPHHRRVTVLSACSGHGFKFAPALGEAVADRIVDGESAFDLTPFRLDRFGDQLSQARRTRPPPPTDTAHRSDRS